MEDLKKGRWVAFNYETHSILGKVTRVEEDWPCDGVGVEVEDPLQVKDGDITPTSITNLTMENVTELNPEQEALLLMYLFHHS